ncbi:EF-hand domain-containing protein [Streptomyces sp. NPDC093089]|uniref:EF-hand domain-containing protein n=1 Tax=Streptomyces sp. NPDC093089 TaxID=3366024 RepID=UPI00382A4246
MTPIPGNRSALTATDLAVADRLDARLLNVTGLAETQLDDTRGAMVQRGDFNVGESVAEALIAGQDANRDKALSFEEFLADPNKA